MADVHVSVIPGQKGGRPYSDFLCKEMLCEYVEGRLSGVRKSSIEQLMKSSPEIKEECRRLEISLQYCKRLQEIEIEKEVLEDLYQQRSKWLERLGVFNWNNWSPPLRWFSQAISVACVTAFVVSSIPWKSLPVFTKIFQPQPIELVRVDRQKVMELPEVSFTQVEVEENDEQEVTQIEKVDLAKNEQSNSVTSTQIGGAASTQQEDVQGASQSIQTDKKNQDSEKKVNQERVASKEKANSELKGFVYRSYPLMRDLDKKAPLIVEKILELGGKKAGKVSLGWRREDSRYFHFSMPEKNKDQLLTFLQGFTRIDIVKERHRRVMPAGYIRFILWIEEIPKSNDSEQ